MMAIKERHFSPLEDLSLEELVPKDNFYPRLEGTLDISFVRELVEDRYAVSSGRPSIDPVVFFKLQLVLFFEDVRSERRLMEIAADRPKHPLVPGLRPQQAFARPLQPHPHPRALWP